MKTIANTPLPSAVRQPDYNRRALRSRIVHLGFGAFHRAHQALLTDRLLGAQGGDWGIAKSVFPAACRCLKRCGNRIICTACWRRRGRPSGHRGQCGA